MKPRQKERPYANSDAADTHQQEPLPVQDIVLHKQNALGRYPTAFQRHASGPTKRAMTTISSRQR